MNNLFRKIHLWLSIPVGLILTIVCLSGAALIFEREIVEAQAPHLYKVKVAEGTLPLPPSALAARIKGQIADSLQLTSLQFATDPERTCIAGFKNANRKTLSVNPYTGEVNGWIEGNSFFQTMRKLHRWMLNPPEQKGGKSVGKAVVGVSTLLMVVILISGLVVWIPRNRKVLRNRLSVATSKGWRRFWYDSHVSLGFYTCLFLLVMALTGLTWSFGWYRTAAYSLFGAPTQQSHAMPQKEKGEKKSKEKPEATFDYMVWDAVLLEMKQRYPVYNSIKLDMKSAQVDTNKGGNIRKQDTANFHPQTGEIQEIKPYSETSKAQKLKSWFYAFHVGSWGGTTTKILYFIAAFVGGILPLSGYYLWLKKKRGRGRHRVVQSLTKRK